MGCEFNVFDTTTVSQGFSRSIDSLSRHTTNSSFYIANNTRETTAFTSIVLTRAVEPESKQLAGAVAKNFLDSGAGA